MEEESIKRLILLFLMAALGVAVLTVRPRLPSPLLEVLVALQEAVQQFALEEQSEYTIEDLIDGGLEAEMSEDGQSCILENAKVWLFDEKPPIFVLRWGGMWYLLETGRWGVFKVVKAEGAEEALRLYHAKKALFAGRLP